EAHVSVRTKRALVIVGELDRIFHGHDVAGMDGVAVINHGREGSGFSGTGGADDEHQSALRHREVFHDQRQTQLIDGLNLSSDMPEDQADIPSLPENIDTEAA